MPFAAERSKRGPGFWIAASVGVLVVLLCVIALAIRLLVPSGDAEILRTAISIDPDLTIVREQDGGYLVQSKSKGTYSVHRLDPKGKTVTIQPVDSPEETK